jgi:hypothetical protein
VALDELAGGLGIALPAKASQLEVGGDARVQLAFLKPAGRRSAQRRHTEQAV